MKLLRRSLWGLFALPILPSLPAQAASAPIDADLITINPTELWLRQIVFQTIMNSTYYERMATNGMSFGNRSDVFFLSDLIRATPAEIETLLTVRWPQMFCGRFSHIEVMRRLLDIYREDGSLHLHLSPGQQDHYTYRPVPEQEVYAKMFPIVKRLLNERQPDQANDLVERQD
jgi:hypothetical protein